MGDIPLTLLSTRELGALADATGFVPDRIEKTVRLLALASSVADHPHLGDRLALTGGTALNMFVLDGPRLSFDLDYNYIGSPDRAFMKTDRPLVETALADLCTTHGLRVKKRPHPEKDHAGGKWDLRYMNAWGRSESIAVDVSYVRRVPLWPTTRRDSYRLGRWQATGVPVMDVHEVAAGKLAAFMTRAYPRDLFDVGLISDLPGLDRTKLRTAFVLYGAGARQDWRAVCERPPAFDASEVANQLRAALPRSEAQRTRPISASDYLTELQQKAALAQRMVLPLNPAETEFLDLLLDEGRVEAALLTDNPTLQQLTEAEPWLRWKAFNVRQHRAQSPH